MLIQGFCLFFISISNIFELIVFWSENTISPFSKVLLRAVVVCFPRPVSAAADVCFVNCVLGEKVQVPAGCTITCYKTSRAYLELRTGPVINRR